jgi:hypothetical protein
LSVASPQRRVAFPSEDLHWLICRVSQRKAGFSDTHEAKHARNVGLATQRERSDAQARRTRADSSREIQTLPRSGEEGRRHEQQGSAPACGCAKGCPSSSRRKHEDRARFLARQPPQLKAVRPRLAPRDAALLPVPQARARTLQHQLTKARVGRIEAPFGHDALRDFQRRQGPLGVPEGGEHDPRHFAIEGVMAGRHGPPAQWTDRTVEWWRPGRRTQ